ncbi:hypothetical protein AAF712_003675 [Marasmius tenuissimus]|uniref:N-acetyltransferase domain-containing protein n=1 Tax=Marasmius tenuissimus TaxID=585030 RepID=A0ABR3A711_9AGAR
MRANKNTVLIGEKVVLVPYETEHVPKYHEWMQDEETRLLTASEPLSLEEEFEMQRKWREDEDKLTFIILAKTSDVQSASGQVSHQDPQIVNLPMVGDVNLFLSGDLSTMTTEPRNDIDEADEFTAEAEIMIAGGNSGTSSSSLLNASSVESAYRRKGMAHEALLLMFRYATARGLEHFSDSPPTEQPSLPDVDDDFPSLPTPIPPRYLLTRITESNEASIQLFQKLGFKVTKRVEVFGEVEMRWRCQV